MRGRRQIEGKARMSDNKDDYYLEEYKSLRAEINAKLKDRLEFSRWGLIGLGVLYSYVFSNPGKTVLFWVPVCLSLAMLGHLNEEHRMVAKAADYTKTQMERWAAGGAVPIGWENYLKSSEVHPWMIWRRWPVYLWNWSPVPLWLSVFALTLAIAVGVTTGLWPSLIAPATCLPG
jgi:hypothetical protein